MLGRVGGTRLFSKSVIDARFLLRNLQRVSLVLVKTISL